MAKKKTPKKKPAPKTKKKLTTTEKRRVKHAGTRSPSLKGDKDFEGLVLTNRAMAAAKKAFDKGTISQSQYVKSIKALEKKHKAEKAKRERRPKFGKRTKE